MFPLGTVLFPGSVLPLHVFEKRYQELTNYCLQNETQFGIVLIEKGHEVGGGEVRASVGCMADIIQHQRFPDGRSNLVVLGTSKINVERWTPDDPYPTALVADVVESSSSSSLDRALEVLRRLCAFSRAAESGGYRLQQIDEKAVAVGVGVDELTYRIADLTPFGPFDRQRVLTAPGSEERLDLIEEQLQGLEEILAAERGKP